jgi:hypothetical protein
MRRHAQHGAGRAPINGEMDIVSVSYIDGWVWANLHRD